MKQYAITVNGVTYDVTVEEKGAGTYTAPQPAVKAQAPQAAEVKKPAGGKGSKAVEAGAAGKVLKLSVKPGDAVKSGDQVAVLEIMKMETPVVTAVDGTIVTVDVAVGDMIEAGAVIATID